MGGRKSHGLRRAAGIIVDVLTGILIAILLACVIARHAFGVRAFSVLTSSMSPTLQAGDLVIVAPASFEEIEEGDVITYVLNTNLDVVTHRVVSKNTQDQTFITKGDANSSYDGSPVLHGNVVGVVRATVPRLGLTLQFLSTPTGKLVGIIIVVAALVALIIVRLLVGIYERDEDETDHDVATTQATEQKGLDTKDEQASLKGSESAKNPEGEKIITDNSQEDARSIGERRRSAIAAVLEAEFDDEWDDDDADWEDDDAWDDDENDDLDDNEAWNEDFATADDTITADDEYDGNDAADGTHSRDDSNG